MSFGKGSKGGGSSGNTSTTVTNALPSYAKPFFMEMMNRAQTESQEPYTQFSGQRLQGFTPEQLQAFGGATDMWNAGTPGQINTATGMASNVYNPNYNPMTYTGGTFDAAAAQQYMDPYIQNVLDVQKGRMTRTYNEQQGQRDADAVNRGAFGGNRGVIADEVARRGLNEQMQAVDAEGLSRAYNSAAGLYDLDRNARLGAQRMTDESSQFGENLGLAAGQQRLQGAGVLGGLGQMEQDLAYQRLDPLLQTGAMQQQFGQAGLDIGYSDWLAEQGWDQNQINFLSSILRGVPVTPSSTTTSNVPSQGWGQTLAGMGLAGYGLARMVT